MAPTIDIQHLSKKYELGVASQKEDMLREALVRGVRDTWKKLRGGSPAEPRSSNGGTIWALNDVSFEVEPGDTIGIIGRNGAGKSTLLKILSRITDPTEGVVRLRGRTGCLLEVGTGFHPDLTGKENIFLNGAILGMTKAEIESKFDEIVAFAEIEKFLYTPVKRYSSGMYVRLAFAVAAHLETEILIVDEVLAVGDLAFQKKCLGKMSEFGQGGRTVLFVSHNLAALENLCRKGIVLQQGELAFSGCAKDAINHYVASVSGQGPAAASNVIDLTRAPGRLPRYPPLLKRLELLTGEGQPLQGGLPVGVALTTQILFELEQPTSAFDVFLAFDNLLGQRIAVASSSYEPERPFEEHSGEQMFVCEIPSFTLVPGEYRVHATLVVRGAVADRVEDAARLSVIGSDFYGTGRMPTQGTCVLEQRWRLRQPTRPVSD